MRRVRVFENYKKETVLFEGYFHCFGMDHEEYESGPGNFSVAIVEKEDGNIEIHEAHLIQFLDKKREGGLKKYEEPKPITEEELVKLWRENGYHMVFIGKKEERVMTGYAEEDGCAFELGSICESYPSLLLEYTHYWTKSTGKQPLQ